MKEMDDSLKRMNMTIQGYETKIAEETRRLEVNTQGKREETQRKLQQATDRVAEATTRLKALEVEISTSGEQLRTVAADSRTAEEELAAVKVEIQNHEQMIKQCKQQQENIYQPYGNQIKRVLDHIGRLKWHGAPPVGPFGLHVKVRDPQKWATLMRTQIGGAMSSFAITDSRDFPQLKKLLQESGK